MSLKSSLQKALGLSGKRAKPRSSDTTIDTLRLQRYFDQSQNGDAFLALYQTAARATGSTDNFFKQNRFFTLHQMVREVLRRGTPGDFAECGCWHGHSTYIVADSLAKARWPNRFWVFDSFEGGLSDKVAEDRTGRVRQTPEREKAQKLKFASDFELVKRTLALFPFVAIHKGWIPETFDAPGLADSRFALVHVDVDLYEPTRDSLAFFGPRMSPGGIIVLDDYGSSAFPGSKRAVDEFLSKTPYALFIETHMMGGVILM